MAKQVARGWRWLAALLAVALGAALIAPLLVDGRSLTPRLERAASAALGRVVTVGGAVSVGLLPTPWISAEDVRVTGAGDGDPLERAGVARVTLAVALWPLASRRIDIGAATLDGVTLALRHRAPSAAAPGETAAPSGAGWTPRAITLRGGRVALDRLTYAAAPDGPLKSFENIEIQVTLDAAGDTPAALRASLRGRADVTIGAVEALGESLTDVTGALAYAGDGLWTLALEGARGGMAEPLLGLVAEARSPARLLDGETVAFTVETRLGGQTTRATGAATADPGASPPELSLTLEIDALDLTALGAAPPEPRAPAGDGRLIPAAPLPQAPLPDIALTLSATAQRVTLPDGLALDDVRLEAALAGRALRVTRFEGGVAGGRISGAASYAPSPDGAPPRATLRLEADGLAAAAIAPRAGALDLSAATLGASLDVSGAGRDTRALAASLSGTAEMRLDGGAIRLRGAAPLIRDMGRFLQPILGRDGASPIRCGLARWRLDDGIATMTGGVLDSRPLIASGRGTVNLRRETLDLVVGVRPREAALAPLSVTLRIGGALAAPTVAAAPADLLSTVATVAGVVVNPLGTIAVLAMGQGDQPVGCAAALAAGARAPATPLGAIGGAAGALGGALGDALGGAAETLGGGVRSLFGR